MRWECGAKAWVCSCCIILACSATWELSCCTCMDLRSSEVGSFTLKSVPVYCHQSYSLPADVAVRNA